MATGFVSCKKCMTCQVVAGSGFSTSPEEMCGSQSDIDEFEELYKERALESSHTGARADCTTK